MRTTVLLVGSDCKQRMAKQLKKKEKNREFASLVSGNLFSQLGFCDFCQLGKSSTQLSLFGKSRKW